MRRDAAGIERPVRAQRDDKREKMRSGGETAVRNLFVKRCLLPRD
jgi:hypothetical protein